MQSKKSPIVFMAVVTVVFASLTLISPVFAASTEKVLHSFSDDGKDGNYPYAGLIFDAAGNLYGTTTWGGANTGCSNVGCGTVFELTPGTNGKWTEKVLHNFNNNGKDGFVPYGGLILDAAGNLYGTTVNGGANTSSCAGGCGTVFELTPGANGKWTEKVLHSFNNNDGANPFAGLISDTAGNLYGTTKAGGANNFCNDNGACGTVFELIRRSNGSWSEKVLHSFVRNGRTDLIQ